jgi:hypothetical protein
MDLVWWWSERGGWLKDYKRKKQIKEKKERLQKDQYGGVWRIWSWGFKWRYSLHELLKWYVALRRFILFPLPVSLDCHYFALLLVDCHYLESLLGIVSISGWYQGEAMIFISLRQAETKGFRWWYGRARTSKLFDNSYWLSYSLLWEVGSDEGWEAIMEDAKGLSCYSKVEREKREGGGFPVGYVSEHGSDWVVT